VNLWKFNLKLLIYKKCLLIDLTWLWIGKTFIYVANRYRRTALFKTCLGNKWNKCVE
jgi:hypothetical protein